MVHWREYFAEDGTPYYFNEATGESSWDKPDELKSDNERSSNEPIYWIPDENEGFMVAKYMKELFDKSWVLERQSGQQVTIKNGSSLLKADPGELQKFQDDLVQMAQVNEPMILNNLRGRFSQDKIYTNVGTILISVNPFKRLPLYTPAITSKYWYRGHREVPPHVYLVADAAFRSLLSSGKNQAVLISGESGAGKTEATKQVLQYIAEVAGSQNGIEQNILHANPILEAFGNAKTLRNNNSSRFGKWIEVMFDNRNQICGARIINYLLEKSRLVHQLEGERNYHIFYFMCAGCTPEQVDKYQLGRPQDHAFLKGPAHIDGHDDHEEFHIMMNAMHQLGFTPDEIDAIFSTTAGCLHLGNIQFVAEGNAAKIKNEKELEISAKLLGVELKTLKNNLLFRKLVVPGQPATDVPLSPAAASDNRDALAKKIYDYQFNWLVTRINQSMVPPADSKRPKIIGVLDIFGFEIFQTNSFEQLCINYANEKLQQLFNQHTFKLEEELYRQEGIKFDHVEFIDNQPVLDLIELKHKGILDMLDEEARLPGGTDTTLITKLLKEHAENAKMGRNIKSPNSFLVHHYAGSVEYCVTGFVDKNKDAITQDLIDLLQKSTRPFVSKLFSEDLDAKQRKRSLGSQFRQQLSDLMATLYSTDQHFIRCIKPNTAKVSDTFDGMLALQQLRYSGVFEAVRIRKTGFPFRYTHKAFYQRYKLLVLDQGMPHFPKDYRDYCTKLITAVKNTAAGKSIDVADLQIGKTMMLYRAGPYRTLELMRNIGFGTIAVRLQRQLRARRVRKQMIMIRTVRPKLQAAMAKRSEQLMEAALQEASQITIAEIPDVVQCRWTLQQVKEEKVLHEKIEVLLKKNPEEAYDELVLVLDRADAFKLSTPLIEKARDEASKITERRNCKADLLRGLEKQDLTLLEDALARARKLMMASSPEAKQAKECIEVLREERKHVETLRAAMAIGGLQTVLDHSTLSVKDVEASIAQVSAANPRGAEAKNILGQARLVVQMRNALLAEDYHALEKTLLLLAKLILNDNTAADTPTGPPPRAEVTLAKEELSFKCARDDVEEKLERAVQEFDLETLELGTQQADQLAMSAEEFPVVGMAKEMMHRLRACKRLIVTGTQARSEDDLREAVSIADGINYNGEDVVSARALMEALEETRIYTQIAIEMVDPQLLQEYTQRAGQLGYETEAVAKAREFLAQTPEKLLRLQYDAAKRLNFRDTQVDVTIKLKDIILSQFGGMFEISNLGVLRSPDNYASNSLFKKDKAREGFLKWTKGNLLTSLTRIEDPGRTKIAKDAFKNLQGYMGDRHYEYTEPLVQELITICIKVEELRDEVLVQVMKQLTENPNPESEAKGWELLFFLLYSFPPSDDICNYLVMFVRKHPSHRRLERYIHEANYREARTTQSTLAEMRLAREQAHSENADAIRTQRQTDARNRYIASRASQFKAHIPLPSQPALAPRAQQNRAYGESINLLASVCLPEEIQEQIGIREEPAPAQQGRRPPPPPPPPQPLPPPPETRARCVYAYAGEEGHLTINPGDVIVVVDKDPSGWWTGELEIQPGVLGVFPGNYVEEL